jgi:hypothetical protein
MTWHPEKVRGHQLERLRLRILQQLEPASPFGFWEKETP